MAASTAVGDRASTDRPVYAVLPAISDCHLINDLLRALLSTIYPGLKTDPGLGFAQIGLVTCSSLAAISARRSARSPRRSSSSREV